MLLRLVTPASPRSRSGNRVTAERWARLLRDLGYRVAIARRYDGERCDALIALHARKSFPSIRRFHRARPGGPLIVALTGTDLYHDLARSRPARLALEWATRLVVLQRAGIAALPRPLRRKARAILQSAMPPRGRIAGPLGEFRVCVVGHLRPVKDPFRVALAARLLPKASSIRILHVGRTLTPRGAARARKEMARNPRYRWLGEVPRRQALRLLAGSRLLVLPSRMEGGANVLSEALAAGVPVLASRIPGSTGILGAGYPGFFPVGDARRLARLLHRSESDPRFYQRLKTCCRRLAPRVRPARERDAWRSLLLEILAAATRSAPRRAHRGRSE